MHLVNVEGRDKLKKILEKADLESSEFINVSLEMKQKWYPNDAMLMDVVPLVPSASIILVYTKYGIGKEYESAYFRHLQRPECMFLLNEYISHAMLYDKDVFFVCSSGEVEYEYLRMMKEFIEMEFGIKTISTKAYLKGKDCKLTQDADTIVSILKQRKTLLINKLKELGIDPTMVLLKVLSEQTRKKLPKKLKNRLEEADAYEE